jgi:hypothetical protein
MQRLAARFAHALATRLVKRWPGLYKALNHSQPSKPEVVLDRAFPCLGFAYAIIARTLAHAMSEEQVIHIVDFGSGDPNLWASLMQSFVGMGHGPTGPPHLRITCVNSNKIILEKMGTRLVKEAEGLDMPFQFHPLNVPLRDLTADMLKVRSGEALGFVSILCLDVLLAEDDRVEANFGLGCSSSKGNGVKDCKQMGEFLGMVKSMIPKVFLLVEQEADHNLNRLVDRFIEWLHYYSAMFDSLEGNYGCEEERVGMEEMFGREIEDIVACEGLEREERHERYGRWMVRFGGAGFKPVRLWCDGKQTVDEASGKDGHKIVNEKAGLVICWHERPLYAVSAWIC